MTRFRLLACVALGAFAMAAAPSAAVAQQRGAAVAAAPVQRAVSFVGQAGAVNGALVLPLAAEADLATRGASLSETERAAIARAIASADFSYGARSTLSLRGIGQWDRILLIGLGEDAGALGYQNAGAVTGRALISEDGPVTVMANGLSAEAASEFALGMGIGEYRSDLYDTDDREPMGPTTIVSDAGDAAQLYARRGRAIVDAMAFVRDLSNEPANVIYPESYVQRVRAAFAGVQGVSIRVLDVPAMERLGMGAILGVGRGSSRPPRMLIVSYRGRGAPSGGPIVLAGKGITFDSGGLSLKTNMDNMEMDMSGAAGVTGAVLALARQGAAVNVVAISALAENMPDGDAIRVGDVLTAMNGTTIEVTNTDAEGRLVLSDALAYAQAHLDPAVIVDVATLTGSMTQAVGDDYAGLFSRHDALADQLLASGEATGERLWRLPMHASYAESLRSPIADIKNTGDGGAGGGLGAYFIGQFVSPETPWAHLDIASVAWGAANDWKPAGSAGFSMRLLEHFVRNYQPVPRGEGENN